MLLKNWTSLQWSELEKRKSIGCSYTFCFLHRIMRPELRDTTETEFKFTVPAITTKLLEFLIPIFYFLNVSFLLLILFCLFSVYFLEKTKKQGREAD